MFSGISIGKGLTDMAGGRSVMSTKKQKLHNSFKEKDLRTNTDPKVIDTDKDKRRESDISPLMDRELTDRPLSMSQNELKSKVKTGLGSLNRYLFKGDKQVDDKYCFIKTKESEFLYYKYLFNTFMQCIFSLISILSSIMQYEFSQSNNETTKSTKYMLALWFCFASSVFLWILIIFEYFIYCRILFLNKNLSEKIWRRETSNVISLVLTLLIFFVHPNPIFIGLEVEIYNAKYSVTTKYSVNAILNLICLLRLWYVIKFYLIYSDYYSPRTQRVCQMNNFDTNLIFSLKANMVKTPYHAYLLLFFVVLFYCSYNLRIFERVLDNYSGKEFSSFWNTIWCLIITMTTVGYGDYYPSSTLGRMIGIIACICGVFLISMLIVTITNVLNFEGTEKNCYLILKRIKLTEEKDKIVAKLLSKYVKFINFKKKNPHKYEAFKERMRDGIHLTLHYFKEKCAEIDATFPAYSNFDNVIDNLEFLDDSLDSLTNKYEILEKHLAQIMEKLNS
jgi:hypothetical protein